MTTNPHFQINFSQWARVRDALITLKFKLQKEEEYYRKIGKPDCTSAGFELQRINQLLEETDSFNLKKVIVE